MKRIILIIIYIIIFTFVSLMIYQMPVLVRGDELFSDQEELLLCITAGVVSGLVVGFFSNTKSKNH